MREFVRISTHERLLVPEPPPRGLSSILLSLFADKKRSQKNNSKYFQYALVENNLRLPKLHTCFFILTPDHKCLVIFFILNF